MIPEDFDWDRLTQAASAGYKEPSSDARNAAVALRNMHVALVKEGFTEEQSLHIICAFIKNNK